MHSRFTTALLCVSAAAAAAAASASASVALPRSRARGRPAAAADCRAGICGGMANYAVAPGMRFYSTFTVPGLPLNKTAIDSDITFYIYANIFFDGGPGQCRDW